MELLWKIQKLVEIYCPWRGARQTLLLCALLLLSACMAKVNNEDAISSVTITSHTIDRTGLNSMITLTGTCPSNTTALKVEVSSTVYDVAPSSMNPGVMVDGSGVPVGSCVNNVLTIQYPVPNPTQSRVIQFEVKAQMPDGKVSLYAAIRDVDYTEPNESLPGFEVCSGGAFSTSGSVTINVTAGLPYSYPGSIIVAGGTASLRLGLQGIIYNDSF